MILQSIKTHKLTKKQLKQILSLKDTNWRFGIKIQNKWFKKNIKSSDLHNVMVIKNTIVGYTLLAQRKFELLIDNESTHNPDHNAGLKRGVK